MTKLKEVPNKLQFDMDTVDAITQLAIVKKGELDDINHKSILAATQLHSLEESIKRTKADFDNKMKIEQKEWDNKKVKMANDLANSDDKISKLSSSLTQREINVGAREQECLKVETERKNIYDLRIETEKFRNELAVQLQKTLAYQSEAQTKINSAAIKETEAKLALQKAQETMQRAEIIFGEAKKREDNSLKALENIKAIQEGIEPKIKEIDEKLSQLSLKEKELVLREKQIGDRIEEDKAMLKEIGIKKAEQNKKDIELSTREEEVLRKELLTKK